MPAYLATPFGLRSALLPGINGYSLGKFNDRTPPTKMSIQSVAITSNVATLAVTIVDGLIPIVGALISVQGTQTVTSGGGANFNVSNVALTAVTITTATGKGTVTFALTSNDIATTTDSGVALVPQPEIGDALTSSMSGLQFAMQAVSGLASNSRDIGWEVTTPSAPSSFTANLQVADFDVDGQYTTVDTTTAVGQRTITGIRGNFVRGTVSAASGGSSPTIVLKILV